jgi:hypothetical protein
MELDWAKPISIKDEEAPESIIAEAAIRTPRDLMVTCKTMSSSG